MVREYGRTVLKEKADAKGVDVLTLIINTIKQEGTLSGAARSLEVAPNALRHHLDKAGLKVVTRPRSVVVPKEQGE